MNWISVKDRPLINETANGWVATDDGEREFMAALQYFDSSKEGYLWWIRHCVLEGDGLCVVGDDDNEPAGWPIEAVTHWMPLPEPPPTESLSRQEFIDRSNLHNEEPKE